MERIAMHQLKQWKNKAKRKPLIVQGARQVGKTWLIKKFGREEYAQMAYINFEESKAMQKLFISDFDIPRILDAIQVETGIQVVADNTLIVFDEIQEAEGGLTSLKYFCENAPEYHVVAAGSLLGFSIHGKHSFPVGKVEFMELYPLNFAEFLTAMNQQPLLALLQNKKWELVKTFREKFVHFLRHYYYIGGMPEVVSSFVNNNDYEEVRKIQKEILLSYDQDFSKHVPPDIVPRLRQLWDSIPSQLAKENRKFIFGLIKKGARAREYETALMWLVDCGLVYQVKRVSKPDIPLKGYEDNSAFKIYVLDVGLMAAMGDIDVKTLLEGNAIFEEFKGALTEQYVLQQLIINEGMPIHYWSAEKATAEVDFVIQYSGKVIPIEVKAEENLKAKSLQSYCQKYNPDVALRISMSDYRVQDGLTNIPLFALAVADVIKL